MGCDDLRELDNNNDYSNTKIEDDDNANSNVDT